MSSTFEEYLDANRDRRMASYMDFLRIPSISALPAHAGDCVTAAEWLATALTAAGAEHVSVEETTDHPVVYGDWLHAGPDAPTVLVYGHYDVQPVDPLDLWISPPFEPIVQGNRMLARGAADDKGQIHLHLMALEALLATTGSLPVNVRYLFEGDEEFDARHLEAWLTTNRDRLAADVAVISDTGFFDGNRPAITIGLRGTEYIQIDVEGTAVDLHSGQFGGAVQNPINALCQIVAALKGPTAGSASLASTTTSSNCPKPSGPRWRHCRSTKRRTGSCSAFPPWSAKPGSRPSSAAAHARRSTSTGSGVASRARARRRSSRPMPMPR